MLLRLSASSSIAVTGILLNAYADDKSRDTLFRDCVRCRIHPRSDPGRIAAGALAGVGFIGAGVVLKAGLSIQGLTTAACIWVVSAIALAVGSGLHLAGAVTFIITIFSLSFLRILERKMPRPTYRYLTITADLDADEGRIQSIIQGKDLSIVNIDYEQCTDSQIMLFHITVSFYRRHLLKALIDNLSALSFIRRV